MIYWYLSDPRFEPGTVADQGRIRIILSQGEGRDAKLGIWKLKVAIRTYKEDGFEDGLKRPVKVAEFKGCYSLKEAQHKAEEWLENFIHSMK